MNLVDKKPVVAGDAFVAPSASLVGDVQVGSKSSIWYGCVLRGDASSIRIGSETNIQEHSLVSVGGSPFSSGKSPTVIGNKVTIGHGAVVHACTVEDGAFVGMGATLLDGVVVEQGAFVAAGALVTENTRIPAGQIWAGNPAKFLRELKGDEGAFIPKSADHYSELAATHAEVIAKKFHDLTYVPEVKPEEKSPEVKTEEKSPEVKTEAAQ
jgi:carbonic anhydrase/acetyltransferase-like protein (isoleucine patch superfamily)